MALSYILVKAFTLLILVSIEKLILSFRFQVFLKKSFIESYDWSKKFLISKFHLETLLISLFKFQRLWVSSTGIFLSLNSFLYVSDSIIHLIFSNSVFIISLFEISFVSILFIAESTILKALFLVVSYHSIPSLVFFSLLGAFSFLVNKLSNQSIVLSKKFLVSTSDIFKISALSHLKLWLHSILFFLSRMLFFISFNTSNISILPWKSALLSIPEIAELIFVKALFLVNSFHFNSFSVVSVHVLLFVFSFGNLDFSDSWPSIALLTSLLE